MSIPFGKWFVMGVAGVSLVMAGWSGSPRAQASRPSALSETYGNWTVRCAVEPAEGDASSRRCAMEQRFVWRDRGSGEQRPLLTVTLTPSSPVVGGMEAVVRTPFGLLLANGLRLRADDGPSATFPFHTCLPGGCVARGSLAREMIDDFLAGAMLHVEADPAAGGDPFRLEGSLAGFSSAYRRLREFEDR